MNKIPEMKNVGYKRNAEYLQNTINKKAKLSGFSRIDRDIIKSAKNLIFKTRECVPVIFDENQKQANFRNLQAKTLVTLSQMNPSFSIKEFFQEKFEKSPSLFNSIEPSNLTKKIWTKSLSIAFKNNDWELAKEILDLKVDLTINKELNDNGETFLWQACFFNEIDIAELIIDNHKEVDLNASPIMYYNGLTPLSILGSKVLGYYVCYRDNMNPGGRLDPEQAKTLTLFFKILLNFPNLDFSVICSYGEEKYNINELILLIDRIASEGCCSESENEKELQTLDFPSPELELGTNIFNLIEEIILNQLKNNKLTKKYKYFTTPEDSLFQILLNSEFTETDLQNFLKKVKSLNINFGKRFSLDLDDETPGRFPLLQKSFSAFRLWEDWEDSSRECWETVRLMLDQGTKPIVTLFQKPYFASSISPIECAIRASQWTIVQEMIEKASIRSSNYKFTMSEEAKWTNKNHFRQVIGKNISDKEAKLLFLFDAKINKKDANTNHFRRIKQSVNRIFKSVVFHLYHPNEKSKTHHWPVEIKKLVAYEAIRQEHPEFQDVPNKFLDLKVNREIKKFKEWMLLVS